MTWADGSHPSGTGCGRPADGSAQAVRDGLRTGRTGGFDPSGTGRGRVADGSLARASESDLSLISYSSLFPSSAVRQREDGKRDQTRAKPSRTGRGRLKTGELPDGSADGSKRTEAAEERGLVSVCRARRPAPSFTAFGLDGTGPSRALVSVEKER